MKKDQIVGFIAPDVLEKFFNGDDIEDISAKKMLDMLTMMGDKPTGIKLVTTLSSFLNAIWKTRNTTSIQNVQKSLTFLQILPSFANFKDDDAVRDEIINFAKIFGEKE